MRILKVLFGGPSEKFSRKITSTKGLYFICEGPKNNLTDEVMGEFCRSESEDYCTKEPYYFKEYGNNYEIWAKNKQPEKFKTSITARFMFLVKLSRKNVIFKKRFGK